ncbi:MAG: hypothetical protein WCV90_07175 [Candidatus Woesearchaeota archaeon]|jgi:hypothetical protein
MVLENIIGNLRDAYRQAVPGTVLCVDQLMKERITNLELRNIFFHTADGMVYSMDNGIPTLRITREATNPLLKNIDAAFGQLVSKGNYLVSSTEFEDVKAAADTITVDLTKLTLQGTDHGYRVLAVDTSKCLSKYNAEEQKLLERVFGAGADYTAMMEMLRTSSERIEETAVFVSDPRYVLFHAEKNPIGMASWLFSFGSNSDFLAVVSGIKGNNYVRAVRKKSSDDLIYAQELGTSSNSLRREVR